MNKPVRVGVIGCGAISGAYLGMAKNFPIVEMAAVADMDNEKAKAAAATFGIGKVCSVDELIADPSIEIVLNLTVPKAHVPIARGQITLLRCEIARLASEERDSWVTRRNAGILGTIAGAAADAVYEAFKGR